MRTSTQSTSSSMLSFRKKRKGKKTYAGRVMSITNFSLAHLQNPLKEQQKKKDTSLALLKTLIFCEIFV